jgi:hypothetical protein
MLSADDHYHSVLENFDKGIAAPETAEAAELDADKSASSTPPPVMPTTPPRTPRSTLKRPAEDNPDSQPALKCPRTPSPRPVRIRRGLQPPPLIPHYESWIVRSIGYLAVIVVHLGGIL